MYGVSVYIRRMEPESTPPDTRSGFGEHDSNDLSKKTMGETESLFLSERDLI